MGRWKRLTRWEYWPTLPLYLPILPTVFWQAIRHRSLALVTAVNPGMPSGGFVLDSKADILSSLASSGRIADFDIIPAHLPHDERLNRLSRIILEKALTFPIVLKPDLGERGSGVLIARDEPSCVAYLAEAEETIIVQKYIPGIEFGIFYERPPNQLNGRITGITHKATTTVSGDGKSTLETLILSDKRAVAQAPIFLEIHKPRLQEIIPKGKTVPLNFIGTHSRGSLFLDACHTCTPEMEAAIDAASKHFSGFNFGRFDIRCSSLEALQKGNEFYIVELNGVTSEPTHIYDPKHSVIYAWKTLAQQWFRAFEIAAKNHENGHTPMSLQQLILRIWDHKNR